VVVGGAMDPRGLRGVPSEVPALRRAARKDGGVNALRGLVCGTERHEAGAVLGRCDLLHDPAVAVSLEYVPNLWRRVVELVLSSPVGEPEDCNVRGHSVSLSAPPGAMAQVECSQGGGRSYVGRPDSSAPRALGWPSPFAWELSVTESLLTAAELVELGGGDLWNGGFVDACHARMNHAAAEEPRDTDHLADRGQVVGAVLVEHVNGARGIARDERDGECPQLSHLLRRVAVRANRDRHVLIGAVGLADAGDDPGHAVALELVADDEHALGEPVLTSAVRPENRKRTRQNFLLPAPPGAMAQARSRRKEKRLVTTA